MHARHRAIRAYLDDGMKVIADDVIWKREWLVDALRTFDGCQVWMGSQPGPPRQSWSKPIWPRQMGVTRTPRSRCQLAARPGCKRRSATPDSATQLSSALSRQGTTGSGSSASAMTVV